MRYKLLPPAVLAAIIAAGITAAADTSSWNDDDIMPLLDSLEIMQGDGMGDYGLDRFVSRAEMAKIAVNSSSHKDETAIGISVSPFSDVAGSSWAAPYILNGSQNGLFKGYMDGSFHPDDTVSFEEAVTMLLRCLGYDDDSFGVSYPYGQVNFAKNIDLLDNVSCSYGEMMTRRNIARMVYNALDTDMKDGSKKLISIFDATFGEDAVIIATPNEDNTVIGYKDGSMKEINLKDSTSCYKETTSYSYSNVRNEMEMGDVLKIKYKSDGDVDYVIYESGNMEGPVQVLSSDTLNRFAADASTAVMRDGNKV